MAPTACNPDATALWFTDGAARAIQTYRVRWEAAEVKVAEQVRSATQNRLTAAKESCSVLDTCFGSLIAPCLSGGLCLPPGG